MLLYAILGVVWSVAVLTKCSAARASGTYTFDFWDGGLMTGKSLGPRGIQMMYWVAVLSCLLFGAAGVWALSLLAGL